MSLLLLPGLDCQFVLLELVAPVGVDLLIVGRLVGCGASVVVHCDVVAGHQLAIVDTVIATRVLVTDADHHQPLVTEMKI